MVQNAIAFSLVAACVAYVAWQLLRTVRSGSGKAGACCSKGCGSQTAPAPATPQVHFIAADQLRRKR